ncbi:FAD-binding oxidoreductase [uncultured Pelagimonas sp.]|uniref:NAD(P)/FAD-dependent oxidoreductase n=1 Tax=uncultured Pelagimonas sp. TaxID=1618102 RepID=UPI00260DFB51|nr:FAD-binding oxidoreductase [uncultured Pelagimonas sp.]
MNKHVVIIGAGIVGVSTAIWLRRAGARVTLVDKADPGQGTSYGNAGVLASCAIVPVTEPGLITKAPGYLLNPNSPLFMRWSYLPKLAPWLFKFMRHANDTDTRRITSALTALIGDSVDQHLSLTEDLPGARAFVHPSDYVFAYGARSDFDKESYGWGLRRDNGFVPELIEGQAVQEYDPAYGPAIKCLALMKEHGFISDPGNYVAALASALSEMGSEIRQSEVQDVTLNAGQVQQVETSDGPIACDAVVLAAGIWSGPLMRKLGLPPPLESERGYHVVFQEAEGAPKVPTMISAGKFVATPMRAGMRCAGIVEFGGVEAGPSDAPFALLRRKMKEALPGVTWRGEETWMGHRPTLADSLPMIGELSAKGVFAGFGHQHIGLTGGPKTGRILAGIILGQPLNTDVSAFTPQRFNGRI